LDFSKDGPSVSTAKSFQLWFLVIQKSVIYLGLIVNVLKIFTIANHKQPIIEVSMYAYKVNFICWMGELLAYADLGDYCSLI